MRTTFQRFQSFFDVFVGLRLRVNVTCASVLVSSENPRRSLSAVIAVAASIVDVKCARRVQRMFAIVICHKNTFLFFVQ